MNKIISNALCTYVNRNKILSIYPCMRIDMNKIISNALCTYVNRNKILSIYSCMHMNKDKNALCFS